MNDRKDVASFGDAAISLERIENAVREGEMPATYAYAKMKQFEKLLKQTFKNIEGYTIDEVEKDPQEYKDFSITTRRTPNYKENANYIAFDSQLKDYKQLIDSANKAHETGSTVFDPNGELVEPVNISYSQVLTYRTPKK